MKYLSANKVRNIKTKRHPILDEFRIKGYRLRNRAVVAPLSRVSATSNGVPTTNMARYYAEYASGGFGLVITEGTYTDRNFSKGYANQPGIVTDEQVMGWRQVTESVHQAGGSIILQLMHAGALSQYLENTAGPSAIKPLRTKMEAYGGEGPYPLPLELSQADVIELIGGFARSAHRAALAGFDGVEIHGANGYLIDQFLTDYTNQRTDCYGGSTYNRVRLAVEVIKAVRQSVDDNFIIGIRLSQGKVNDFDYTWSGGASDAEIIFPQVARAGADYIHFASEGTGFDHGCVLADGTSLPRLARELTGLPVIANGGLHDPDEAYRILQDGHGDLAALGRGAIANPDWPDLLARGIPIPEFDPMIFSTGVTIEATRDWQTRQAEEKINIPATA